MKVELSKEKAEKILSTEGHVKGEVFRNHGNYIKYKEGEAGVEKVEKRMAELGAPIKLRETAPMQWKDIGPGALLILVINEVLGWEEEEIYEMGRQSVKTAFITKLFVNYFVSKERAFRQAPAYWKKYFDVGSVEPVELKEDYGIVRIKGFHVHPLICHLYAGYMHGMTEFIVKSAHIAVEETKCTHKGDDYHEYKIKLV